MDGWEVNGREIAACIVLDFFLFFFFLNFGFFSSFCRATWYETPEYGSCGYGKLDTVYKFGPDAVGAYPDVREKKKLATFLLSSHPPYTLSLLRH